jgi:ABC-type sulfate transport system permease component
VEGAAAIAILLALASFLILLLLQLVQSPTARRAA